MSQTNSSSSSSAQDLLDALLEVRELVEKRGIGISGIFRDSGRFGALMRDLHPEMNREISIISLLINEGLLMRLHSVNVNERARVSGQIKVWLDNFGLKAEDAQTYSDVLLAFCNGETQVGMQAPQSGLAPSAPAPAVPSLNNADALFAQGALCTPRASIAKLLIGSLRLQTRAAPMRSLRWAICIAMARVCEGLGPGL